MKQQLQSPQEAAAVAQEIDAIMVELHGATMKQMIFDENLREGIESRWAKFSVALAEYRKRKGYPAPRADEWTPREIIARSAMPGRIER